MKQARVNYLPVYSMVFFINTKISLEDFRIDFARVSSKCFKVTFLLWRCWHTSFKIFYKKTCLYETYCPRQKILGVSDKTLLKKCLKVEPWCKQNTMQVILKVFECKHLSNVPPKPSVIDSQFFLETLIGFLAKLLQKFTGRS